MNAYQLILIRLYGITLGRFAFFALLFKKLLVLFLIKRSSDKYVAASKYFDYKKFLAEDKKI